mgnify:CR=1 FL=1
MCEYFVKADPIQYEQRTRTIRLGTGVVSLPYHNPFTLENHRHVNL